jgi:hypothetical protein
MRELKKSEESVKMISYKFAAFGIEQTAASQRKVFCIK